MSELVSTARRRELGAALRQLREQHGFNGLDMALRLGWTQTMVSRIETGKRPVTPMEVVKYTSACGVHDAQQDALIQLADEPDDYRLKLHDGKLPDELRALIFHESTANTIENYETIYISGILQTEDYARAIFEAAGLFDATGIENRIKVRMARREVLTRVYPAQCEFFVHESALRVPIGGPRVMGEQMLHLLFASSRPQCSIRVVPASAGAYGLAFGSFHIFGYAEGAPVIYVEHQTTSEFLESPQELRSFRSTLKRLATVALDDARSREYIARLADDYERQGDRDGSGAGRPQELAQE
jgi:transcriptional regulator with XRE-family HTH domain